MAVSWIAYENLNPGTRELADKLIALNPKYEDWKKSLPDGLTPQQQKLYLFMIASTWPDQIRNDPAYHDDGDSGGNRPPATGGSANIGYTDRARHKYWHFIDVPFTQDGEPLGLIPYPNAESEIAVWRQTLASNAPDALKSYDLVWLLHVVGDIHQPLHAVSRFTTTQPDGDAGGNLVSLCPTPCKDVLHWTWDGTLGPNTASPEEVAAFTATLHGAAVSKDDLSAHAWVEESVALAKSVVYVYPPIGDGAGPFTLTQVYKDRAVEVSKQRVYQAGMRLANILNAELK
jgi:hypothetical protein